MQATISHYRILHPLGAGGMGEVYAGIDETLKRRVALKAIRPEQRLDAVSKARFLREARLLSQLDHPNICRVYDYIEGDDRDWLVLELIEGKTLQSAIAAGLDPASRLRIAQQIADVLVATHTAGVVHRDLKPGNVMLTRGDHVKVLDFGLARSLDSAEGVPEIAGTVSPVDPLRAHDDPQLTRTMPGSGELDGATDFHVRTEGGALTGTPAYMSPEQARGEPATAASDMYSFGLLLQELYTRRGPYPQGMGVAELLERAQRADTLAPVGVPGEIAALINRLKQLAPAQRPTAVETAARLTWIHDRPKRLMRNAAAAVVCLAALLGAIKYTVDLARERTLAIAAREEADRRRVQAENLIGFMLGDLRKRLEPVGRLEILDEIGNKAMDYFAAVPETDLSDEELLRRSAALYQIGEVRIAQGNLEGAAAPLQESLTLARTLVERSPHDGERIYGLAQSHFWVGFVDWRRHKLDAAEREFRAYLQLAERLVSIDPVRDDWRRELAYATSNIGSVLEARGDLDGALEQYRASIAVEQALLTKTPSDKDLRHSIAASHNLIGVVLRSIGRFDEALEQFRAELRIREGLLAEDPSNATFQLRRGIAHAHVAHVLSAQGRTSDAIVQYEHAVTSYRRLTSRDPANSNWQRELGTGLYVLASAHLAIDQPRTAIPLLKEAVAIAHALTRQDPTNALAKRDLADHKRALGEALLAVGQRQAALVEGEAAARTAAELLNSAPDDINSARSSSLAHALLAAASSVREPLRAKQHWQASHDAIVALARGSRDYRLLDPLVVSLLRLGRRDEAAPFMEQLSALGYRDPRYLRAIASGQSLRPAPVNQEDKEIDHAADQRNRLLG